MEYDISTGIGFAAVGVMWEMVSAWQHPELIVGSLNTDLLTTDRETANTSLEGLVRHF